MTVAIGVRLPTGLDTGELLAEASALEAAGAELLWADEGAVDRTPDGGTVSLVSRASLERLRDKLGVEEYVDGRRFRMLFEIDGVGAHEEDEWIGARVRVGDAELAPLGDVGRCVVTTRSPDTGQFAYDTLKALANYRREGVTERLPFGVYCDVVVPGRVRVGDPVRAVAHESLQA